MSVFPGKKKKRKSSAPSSVNLGRDYRTLQPNPYFNGGRLKLAGARRPSVWPRSQHRNRLAKLAKRRENCGAKLLFNCLQQLKTRSLTVFSGARANLPHSGKACVHYLTRHHKVKQRRKKKKTESEQRLLCFFFSPPNGLLNNSR